MSSNSQMSFARFGDALHLQITSAKHLEQICKLDHALWVANNAPVDTINCDKNFLNILDADNNNRITPNELCQAIRLLLDSLKEHSGINDKSDTLTLDSINTETQQGTQLLENAKQLLKTPDAKEITLDTVKQLKSQTEKLPVSETGIVLPDATDDIELKMLISDAISLTGGAFHSSGRTGLSQDLLNKFLDEFVSETSEQGLAVLGADKIKKYSDPKFKAQVLELISKKTETEQKLQTIRSVENIILLQANIIEFTNNFVSFPHLYNPKSRAAFEMGTLVMDGRRFNFALKVADRAQHAIVSKTSNIFVLYVEVYKSSGQKTVIAVPVTSGGKGNLCIGKRGVFYDIDNKEFDACVVDIIENPISFREAIVAPFKRIGKLLSGKIESITTAAEKKLDGQTASALNKLTSERTSEPAPQQKAAAPGMLMGVGVAIAALGSAFAYIAKTLADTENLLKLLIAVFAAIGAVILATAIVAFLKLKKRDLSSVLEGSGWGINARMRLTLKQSRYFTQRPKLPLTFEYVLKAIIKIVIILAIIGVVIFGIKEMAKTDSPPSVTETTQPEN